MFFEHTDWLGTLRRENTTANPTSSYHNCTSLPFGDGLNCTWYNDTLHFTGKERDAESGLDFGARYNSSQMGRFMSPDRRRRRIDPQTLNIFARFATTRCRSPPTRPAYIVNCTTGSAKDQKNCNKAADRFEKQREKGPEIKERKSARCRQCVGQPRRRQPCQCHVQVSTAGRRRCQHSARLQERHGIVTPGTTSDHQPNINAEFSEDLGGKDLGQTIAHEGSHIEDDMNFLKSYDPATGQYFGALNFTHFDTEFQAFEAGSMVKPYSMFPKGPSGYQQLTNYIYQAYPNADQLVFPPSLYPQGTPHNETSDHGLTFVYCNLRCGVLVR